MKNMSKMKICIIGVFVTMCLTGCSQALEQEQSKGTISEESEGHSIETVESKEMDENSWMSTEESILEQNNVQYEASSQLSNQIDSFQLQIHDKVYSFPFAYEDLMKNGWVIQEKYASENDEISSRQDKLVWHVLENLKLDFFLYNPDTTIHSYQECVVAGVTFSFNDVSVEDFVFIPGGFQIGVATKEDVLAAFREPDKVNEMNDGVSYVEYRTDNVWASVTLRFDAQGILTGYNAENPIATEGYSLTEGSDKVIPDYIVPMELSGSPVDAIVNFDGQLYRLPTPVSEFLKNGWETDDSEIMIPGNGISFFQLTRDGIELHCTAYNFNEQACILKNGVIVKLSSTDIYQREFEVSGGITFFMTEEDLVDILNRNNLEYEIKELSDGVQYTFPIGKLTYENYICISFEEGKVGYITVSKHEVAQ